MTRIKLQMLPKNGLIQLFFGILITQIETNTKATQIHVPKLHLFIELNGEKREKIKR